MVFHSFEHWCDLDFMRVSHYFHLRNCILLHFYLIINAKTFFTQHLDFDTKTRTPQKCNAPTFQLERIGGKISVVIVCKRKRGPLVSFGRGIISEGSIYPSLSDSLRLVSCSAALTSCSVRENSHKGSERKRERKDGGLKPLIKQLLSLAYRITSSQTLINKMFGQNEAAFCRCWKPSVLMPSSV